MANAIQAIVNLRRRETFQDRDGASTEFIYLRTEIKDCRPSAHREPIRQAGAAPIPGT